MKIYTTGYPRSGNTWLGWLLADCLDANWNSNGDLLKTGVSNKSGHEIVKTHSIEQFGKTVFIYRDPRDVAVSVMHYRVHPSLESAILSMSRTDNKSLSVYEAFAAAWHNTEKAIETNYEILSLDTAGELVRICTALGFTVSKAKATKAAARQTIANAQKRTNDTHTYRRGVPGTWREYFTRKDAELFQLHLGKSLEFLGYETGDDWVMDVTDAP